MLADAVVFLALYVIVQMLTLLFGLNPRYTWLIRVMAVITIVAAIIGIIDSVFRSAS